MVVMVLSAVVLAIMASLIYMLTVGTQVSGGMKRYETAQEAADGGKEVVFDWLGHRSATEFPDITGISITGGTNTACLANKISAATKNWPAGCDASMVINTSVSSSYDFRFDLGNYRVYAKIVNTVVGNAGVDPGVMGLARTGVVRSNPGEVPVTYIPFLYTIEVESMHVQYDPNAAARKERAKLSILYRF
jgi:hypothetical protein